MSTAGAIGLLGLKTSPNPLIQRPGSMSLADNCILSPLGEAQQRRGQDWADIVGVAGDRIFQVLQTQGGSVLTHYGPDSGLDGTKLCALIGANQVVVGSYASPAADVLRMKGAELAKAFLWTTSTGLYRLDENDSGQITAASAAAPLRAGIPRPGDFKVYLSDPTSGARLTGNVGTSGNWMPKDRQVGYRAVVGRKDSNGAIRLSAPCARLVIVNPADTVASLTRTGGNTVTATVAAGHGYRVGDVLQLSPGSADFATATNYTLTVANSTTIVWTSAGANVTLAAQTLTSGTKNTQLWIDVKPGGVDVGVLVGDFIQLHRTLASASATADPGDECFQCYERTIAAADLALGYVVVVDTTPDVFLGGPLYTNANTGAGIAYEHEQPPICRDICVYAGRMWGTQTKDIQRMPIRLLGVGSPNGLVNGDTIAIGTRYYYASQNFIVYDGGFPTQNIQQTAASFITSYFGSATDPSYLRVRGASDGTGPTGNIMVESVSPTAAIFYAGTSRPSAFQDPLPAHVLSAAGNVFRSGGVVTFNGTSAHGLTTGDTACITVRMLNTPDASLPLGLKLNVTVTGANNFTYVEAGADFVSTVVMGAYKASYPSVQLKRQLRFSKLEQPEAWPLPNFPSGLPSGAEVLRAKPLRGSLYIFNAGSDIYTASGSGPPFNVQQFDGTAWLIAPDSLEEHSGRLLALTSQGLTGISSAGCEVLSLDIDDTLRARITAMKNKQTTALPFGVSYESDRQFHLWLPYANAAPATPSSWLCSEAYVYHSDQRAWTRWQMDRSCGLVRRTTDTLVMGAFNRYQRAETKTWGWADAADGIGNVSYTGMSSAGTIVSTVLTAFDTVRVNDVVTFPNGELGIVLAITVTVTQARISTNNGSYFVNAPGQLAVHTAIEPLAAEWLVATSGAPGVEKHWRDWQLHTNLLEAYWVALTFGSERTSGIDATDRQVTMTTTQLAAAGSYGNAIVEDVADNLATWRGSVPLEASRAAMLRMKVDFAVTGLVAAYTRFKLLGVSLTSESISERTGKIG